MRNGYAGGRGTRTLTGMALIAGLLVAQNAQAAALRLCPHHDGSPHSLVDDAAIPHDGHEHRAAPGHPSESDQESHDGPCDCLGPCGPSPAVQTPAAPAESAFAEVASGRAVPPPVAELGLAAHIRPFALPYPNAPPA